MYHDFLVHILLHNHVIFMWIYCERKSACDTNQTLRLMHMGAGYLPLGATKGVQP